MVGLPPNSTESEPQPETESDPIEAKTWREKLLRNWMLLRTTHEAMMVDKIRQQNRIVRDHVRGQLKESGIDPSGEEGDDEMGGVSVGNEYHYHVAPTEKTPETPPPTPQPTPQQPRPNWLAPAVIALLTGLLGLAIGSTFTGGGPDTDTDTATDVRTGFGEPVYVEEDE